jgi:hypothetical protein
MAARINSPPTAAAVPSPAPQTIAPDVPAPPPPRATDKPPPRKAKGEPEEEPEANLAPLNFRISASFRREFKVYAANRDLKLNELLRRCFEVYRRQQRH